MNEKQIQNGLYDWLERRGLALACPNYTPADWWECDLFTITPAGMFVEYEVKVSRSDFFHDSQKSRPGGTPWFKRGTADSKHERLEKRDKAGPSRFFFVTPAGLLQPEEIPAWAGWIEITPRGRRHVCHIRKKAPQLHREKAAEKVIAHCRSVFYYRYWNLRRKGSCKEAEKAEAPTGPLV